MDAVVSGSAAIAFIFDGTGIWSLHPGPTGPERRPRRRYDIPALLGDAQDLAFLEDVDEAVVLLELDLAHTGVQAIHLALMLCDPKTAASTIALAAGELDNLLARPAVAERAERILDAKPMPVPFDLGDAAGRCRSGGYERAARFFEALSMRQPAIREVRHAWDILPAALFSSIGDRAFTDGLMAREGLFRSLVRARATGANLDAWLAAARVEPAVTRVHAERYVESWAAALRPPSAIGLPVPAPQPPTALAPEATPRLPSDELRPASNGLEKYANDRSRGRGRIFGKGRALFARKRGEEVTMATESTPIPGRPLAHRPPAARRGRSSPVRADGRTRRPSACAPLSRSTEIQRSLAQVEKEAPPNRDALGWHGPSIGVGRHGFITTQWSVVLRAVATSGPTEGTRAALAELCQGYRGPLVSFACSFEPDRARAEDLVHGFLVRVIDTNLLSRVDDARGRLRSFLCTALRRYAIDRYRRERPTTAVDLDVLESRTRAADRLYDRAWAQALVARARARLADRYAQAGNGPLFEALIRRLEGEDEGGTLRELGAKLGKSEGAVTMALHQMRKRLHDDLRAEVGETVAQPEDADDEMRWLLAALEDEP